MRAAFIDVSGLRTRYLYSDSTSDGRPLLLLHGYGITADSWIRNIDSLGKSRPVFAPDYVGHGFTQAPAMKDDPAHGAAIAHLLSWIDVMGWDEFDVLGSSFGGLMAALLYFERPKAVNRVVIVGSGSTFLSEEDLRKTLVGISERNPVAALAALSLDGWRSLIADAMPDPTLVPESLLLSLLTAYASPELQEFQFAAERGKLIPGALRPFLVSHKVSMLQAPTLVIWGQEDAIGWQCAVDPVKQMPDARLEVLPNCGHLPYLDQPERFNTLVDEFMRGAL